MRESNNELRSEEFMDEAIAAHQGAVYRLALSQTRSAADAQDVMQDVFIKLMRSQVRFRDSDPLRAWLLRVTINQCRDLARQAWHRRVEVVEEPDLGSTVTQDEAVELLMEHPVWRAMDALKESDRSVLHLRYVEELSISEIAEALSCTQVAVRVRLRRARARLRQMMAAQREQQNADVPSFSQQTGVIR